MLLFALKQHQIAYKMYKHKKLMQIASAQFHAKML